MNDALKRIAIMLKEKGTNVSKMCEEIGIAKSTYYTWQQKDKNPDAESLIDIARYLDTTTDYIMTGAEKKEPVSRTRKTRIYIAGPISKRPYEEALEEFDKTETLLRENGYHTLNPVHLFEIAGDPDTDLQHGEYMQLTFQMLALSDAVVLLPGWNRSKGTLLEIDMANASGKRIYYPEEFEALVRRPSDESSGKTVEDVFAVLNNEAEIRITCDGYCLVEAQKKETVPEYLLKRQISGVCPDGENSVTIDLIK